MKNRLSKVLAAAGVASRRGAEALIFSGKVAVNGKVIIKPEHHVSPDENITVEGYRINKPEGKVYFILNKPKGKICTAEGRQSVLRLFRAEDARLFTVGRLDKDTEGLLIVTNDGDFAQRVIHPSSGIHKEYIAKTDHEITDEHLKKISAGTNVEGIFVKPMSVKKVRRSTVKIVVGEGKKREVREMIINAGLEVRELKRVRIGGLKLGDLPLRQYRPLTYKEREQIFEG